MFNPFRVAPKREEEPQPKAVDEIRAAYKEATYDWSEAQRKGKLDGYKALSAKGHRDALEPVKEKTAANVAWLESHGFEVVPYHGGYFLVRWLP